MIIAVQNNSDEVDINKLTHLVLKQMEFIGSKHDFEKANYAVKNALKNKNSVFFIKIDEENNLTGFAFGNIGSGLESGADYLWINELFVEPGHRRKNAAMEIFGFMENWAKQNGIKYIATMTSPKNEAAIKFYEKAGYEISDIKWIDKTI